MFTVLAILALVVLAVLVAGCFYSGTTSILDGDFIGWYIACEAGKALLAIMAAIFESMSN